MAEFAQPEPVFPGHYSKEMKAEMDRIAALITEEVDFSYPPDAAMRALDERNNAIWNIRLPQVTSVRNIRLPADETLDAAPCDAVIYEPEVLGRGLIFYIHGGGWALMNLATHDRLMRALCNEAQMTVVGVHYRLAPESPYPEGLKDVISAFRAILSHRTELALPHGPVIIAGDSAGANLAMATMLHEIDGGKALPAGALLFYGVYGADFETPSYQAYAEGYRLTKPIMQQFWDWYVPDKDARGDFLVAPLAAGDAQLQALPPLFLAAAELDPLASESQALKQRLDHLGRHDELLIEPGVIHGFMQMTAVLNAARRVMRRAAQAANNFVAAA